MTNLSRMLALTAAAVAIFMATSEAQAGGHARSRFAAPVYQPVPVQQNFGAGYSYQRESFQQFNGGYQQQFAAPVPVYNSGFRFRNRFGNGGCYNGGYGNGGCLPPVAAPLPAYGYQQSRGFSLQFQRSRGVGFGY